MKTMIKNIVIDEDNDEDNDRYQVSLEEYPDQDDIDVKGSGSSDIRF